MVEDQLAGPEIPVSQPAGPMTKIKASKGFPWLAVIITVVVTALVVAAVGYFFFFQGGDQEKVDLANQVSSLETERSSCVNELTACHDNLTSLQNDVDNINEEAKMMEELPYNGWTSYIDKQFGLVWRHPANWKVEEGVIKDSLINNKNGFCLHFTSTDKVLLNVCYRLKGDYNSTTWFRTGLGYNELTKASTDFSVLGKNITEKTLFGENGAVKTIIYAQNIKDDETGYPARFAAGDYYFTAMADDFGNNDNGISLADQKTLDLILGSVRLSEAGVDNK